MPRSKRKQNRKNKGAEGVHDGTIDSLVKRLADSDDYDAIGTKFEYRFTYNHKDTYGEMDAFAFRTVNGLQYVLLFEIKANDSRKNFKKALEQLDKDEAYMRRKRLGDRFFKFYVTKDSIEYVK